MGLKTSHDDIVKKFKTFSENSLPRGCPKLATGLLSSRLITACLLILHSIYQCFSTFLLKGAKSRPMALLDNRTKQILTQLN